MRWAIAAVLYGAAGFAQAVASDRLDTLTVTVTAEAPENNLPLAVTTVDARELPAANEQSLQDLLEAVPGLFALNNDNAAQGLRVSIRGFGTRAAFGVRGIRVLVDGVPMTLPDGQTELDALDIALLDSAQVIRGPSATLFGNAAGGAILLKTRRPTSEPEAQLDLLTGSFGSRRLRLEGSGHGLLGSLLSTETDGFREHAATESDLINASLEQALGTGRFTASISSLDIEALDPGGLTAAQVKADRKAARPQNVQFDSGETIEQQRLALGWSGAVGNWMLQTTGYGGQREFANRLPFTGGGQVAFDRSFAGLGLTGNRRLGRHHISLGLDAQTQSDDRRRYDNINGQRGALTLDQEERARGAGLFLRDTISLNNTWESSFGLRYDRLRLTADDVFLADGNDSGSRSIRDWSADASLAHWRGTHMLYGRLATSFETPTINELANPNGGGFNAELGSTDALNLELGAKGRWHDLRYSVAVYRIDVDDELLPFELANQPGRRFFRNAGETQRQGLELSAERALTTQWSLSGSLNVAKHEFASGALEGKRLPGIPGQTAGLSVNYQQAAFSAALIGQYVGRLFADDANATSVSSYSLFNLQAAWQVHRHLKLKLGVDNLLDKEYNDNIRINAFGSRYFEPAAGRNYRASISFSL